MAHVQYNQAGIATALHVTAEEWERPRRMATLSGDHAQMFHSMRVYVTPEPRRRRWYDTATEKLRAAGRWIMRRWREWKARIEAPELGPRRATPPPPRPLLYRGMLYSSLHFRSNPAAGVRIVAVCAVIAMLATATRAACPPGLACVEAAANESEVMPVAARDVAEAEAQKAVRSGLALQVTSGGGVDSDAVAAPAPPATEPSDDLDGLLVRGGWCVVQRHETGAESAREKGEPAKGCDGGLGAGLTRQSWHGLIPAVVIGTHTLGPGLAYVIHRDERRTIAVGAFALVEWSMDDGIDDRPRMALGATFSSGGAQ